jgi:DNA-binding Xre family transcriptional regulator
MLRFRFRQLLMERERQAGRRIPLREVAETCGISVQVLSSLNSPDRSITTNSAFLECLCRFLHCELGELAYFDPPLGEEQSPHVDQLYPGRRA